MEAIAKCTSYSYILSRHLESLQRHTIKKCKDHEPAVVAQDAVSNELNIQRKELDKDMDCLQYRLIQL